MIKVIRILIKAVVLFVLCNAIYMVVDPAMVIGRMSLYNTIYLGRTRLPYGENPVESYSLSLNNLDAMFASHVISHANADDAFRVVLIGDSATWGWFLTADQTYDAHLNVAGLQHPDGQRVKVYNLGYPIMSLTKDLMLLDYARRYDPDLVVWLVSLESFPRDKQTYPPLVQNNPDAVLPLVGAYDLSLEAGDFITRDFLDNTIVGSRRELADLLRLQVYGASWSATGIDQYIPEVITYTPNDLDADLSWEQYTEPSTISADDLAFDVLAAGIDRMRPVPVVVINEPMFIADGANSDQRYNTLFPRWAYEQYRVLLAEAADTNNWIYVDWWDRIAPEHFTDSPVHLSPEGSAQLAEYLEAIILDEQTIREQLRTFITHELIRDPDYALGNDEGIITGGLMDSFSLAEFGVFVEDTFGVYIPDPDLTVENLDTLDQMVARVLRDL